MGHGSEAAVGFADSHGDTIELSELTEFFGEMAPLIEIASAMRAR